MAVIQAPNDFIEIAKRVHEYLDRALSYSWKPIADEASIPLDVPCVVTCKMPGNLESRCLAFAARVHGRICWYGVMAAWHAPEELYGVVGYIPFDDVAEFFV